MRCVQGSQVLPDLVSHRVESALYFVIYLQIN